MFSFLFIIILYSFFQQTLGIVGLPLLGNYHSRLARSSSCWLSSSSCMFLSTQSIKYWKNICCCRCSCCNCYAQSVESFRGGGFRWEVIDAWKRVVDCIPSTCVCRPRECVLHRNYLQPIKKKRENRKSPFWLFFSFPSFFSVLLGATSQIKKETFRCVRLSFAIPLGKEMAGPGSPWCMAWQLDQSRPLDHCHISPFFSLIPIPPPVSCAQPYGRRRRRKHRISFFSLWKKVPSRPFFFFFFFFSAIRLDS